MLVCTVYITLQYAFFELPKPLFEGEAKCKAVDKRMIFILNIQIKLSLVLKVRVICVYGLLQLTFASIVKNFDG